MTSGEPHLRLSKYRDLDVGVLGVGLSASASRGIHRRGVCAFRSYGREPTLDGLHESRSSLRGLRLFEQRIEDEAWIGVGERLC